MTNLAGFDWFGPWDATAYYGQSSISPATIDESLSLQTKVQRLLYVVEQITDQYEAILKVPPAIDARLDALLNAVRAQLAATTAELEALIDATNKAVVAWNPTNGTRHGTIDDAVDDVYDFTRVHAIFAGQYDELGLTAEQYDALGLTATEYDLLGAVKLLGVELNVNPPGDTP